MLERDSSATVLPARLSAWETVWCLRCGGADGGHRTIEMLADVRDVGLLSTRLSAWDAVRSDVGHEEGAPGRGMRAVA